MKNSKANRDCMGEAGFTLVELMVSLVVLSIAISAAFAMAFSLMDGYKEHRHAVRVESTARLVLDRIASSIRSASPGLIGGEVWNVCTGGNIPTIAHVNSTTAPDSLELIHAVGGAIASAVDGTGNPQDLALGLLVVDDNTLFEPDLWTPAVIISPQGTKGHLLEVFAPSGNVNQLNVRPPGNCAIAAPGVTTYDPGSFVVRAVHERFFVDDTTYNVPFLMLDPDGPGILRPEPVAEGVEDLQVAVGVENGTDPTGLDDAGNTTDEWHHNVLGDAAPPALTGGQWRPARYHYRSNDKRHRCASVVLTPSGRRSSGG